MIQILDGLKEQEKIRHTLLEKVRTLDVKPTLAIILIGNHAPSLIYVARKKEFAASVGIETKLFHLDTTVSLDYCLTLIQQLNQDPAIHGILLQLPVPQTLDSHQLIQAVDPIKDVDGLHPLNAGKLMQQQAGLYPCTPQGCLHLIHCWKQNLSGLVAVVVGRSNLVGRPIATLLTHENVTVIQAHSHTKNLKEITRLGDVLVVAVGKPKFITKDFVKDGACVIDVGISKDTEERTVGDVDFESVKNVASAISPVPGGVGPMTISYLMMNLMKACCLQLNLVLTLSK